jgi:hypothetical protein
MAGTKHAAVGFRVHSGWVAMVAVCLERGAPVVLARKRAHLVEDFSYTFRQPYHTAARAGIGEGREFIARVKKEAKGLAVAAIREVEEDARQQGAKLTRSALLLASGRELPELEKILASHALIHTADGELFREALAAASERCKLKMESVKEKELLARASMVLQVQPGLLMKRVSQLRKLVGAPWSQDEKYATLAAWVALQMNDRDS